MLSAASGCELSTTIRVKTAWKKFNELKPNLSSRHLSFKTHGCVYSSCVRSAMLHASETWPVTKSCLLHLQRNDRAMIRQICNVKPQDTATIRSTELLARLGIEDLDLILKERRLRWYGHVECSNGGVKTAFDIQVNGKRGPGRPKIWILSTMNKKNTINYPKSAAMGFLSKGLKNEFETAIVNEPSVFEPLKFYCIYSFASMISGHDC